MTSRVVWNGDEWQRRDLVPAVELGLLRAGVVLSEEMRTRMGSEGGGVSGKTKKGRNKYRAAPPGAFPGVRSGTLRRSLSHSLVGDLFRGSVKIRRVRVGTNIKYGLPLERGTSRMAARPWANRSLALGRSRINREFTKTVSRSLAESARRRSTL